MIKNNSLDELEDYCKKANFIFNLVGVNRPKDEKDYMEDKCGFANMLFDLLKKHNNK